MDLLDENRVFPSCKKKGKIILYPRISNHRDFERKRIIFWCSRIIETVEGFKYSLKIVVTVEDDTMTVITNYPLKKGRKNESLLR